MTALDRARAQVRNAEVVRAMGMFAACLSSWGEANARAMAASDVAGTRNAVLLGLARFVRLALQVAMIGYGAWLVLTDAHLSAGVIFAAAIVSARALAPVDQVVSGWRSLVEARQSFRRLSALLAAAERPVEPMQLPAPEATLGAEQLVYAAGPGQAPILKGLSFAIGAGEVVGIVGPSGAGKSTLARLLVGALQPSAGLVRIGGDDLRHWPAEALGPFIGYLPQDVELFPATVAQNIARMTTAPDADEVVAAARLANCHELVQRLPAGYDTRLGPGGHILSGGQRQQIALARAFYGAPRVVVLDEPNASLDKEGEQALAEALQAARASGMTCIVISQRTSIVPALTMLMVMKEGRITAFGPKETVLRSQIRPASSVAGSSPAALRNPARQSGGALDADGAVAARLGGPVR